MKALLTILLLMAVSCSESPTERQTIRSFVGSKVVRIFGITEYGQRSEGTGFSVIAPSGKLYLLTNRHICSLADKKGQLSVEFPNLNRLYKRKVIEVSTKHDLCLVESLPSFKGGLFIADNLDRGDKVFVVGHPKLFALTVAEGEYIEPARIYVNMSSKTQQPVVIKSSPLEDILKIVGGQGGVLIQRAVPFVTSRFNVYSRGGNSGSPIVDKNGNVISVLFAGNPGDVMETYGVPLRYVKRFLEGY